MFSDNVKNLRLKYGLTQEQLANKLNVSRKTVSSWENNRNVPDLFLMKRISQIFNVSINELSDDKKTVSIKKYDNDDKKLLLYIFFIQFFLIIMGYLTLLNVFNTVIFSFLLVINTVVISIFTKKYRIVKKNKSDFMMKSVIIIFIFLFNLTLGFRQVVFYLLVHQYPLDFGTGIILGKSIIILILTFSVGTLYELKFMKRGELDC